MFPIESLAQTAQMIEDRRAEAAAAQRTADQALEIVNRLQGEIQTLNVVRPSPRLRRV